MNYHDISPVPKKLMRRTSVVASLESEQILLRMEQAGWLRPVEEMPVGNSRISFYTVRQVEAAVARLEREALPPLKS